MALRDWAASWQNKASELVWSRFKHCKNSHGSVRGLTPPPSEGNLWLNVPCWSASSCCRPAAEHSGPDRVGLFSPGLEGRTGRWSGRLDPAAQPAEEQISYRQEQEDVLMNKWKQHEETGGLKFTFSSSGSVLCWTHLHPLSFFFVSPLKVFLPDKKKGFKERAGSELTCYSSNWTAEEEQWSLTSSSLRFLKMLSSATPTACMISSTLSRLTKPFCVR